MWKTLKTKIVHRNPWFSIEENTVIRPDGTPGKYFVFKKKDGVIAIPYDGRKTYLVNINRFPLKKNSWEFPMGISENKNFKSEARRELLEETGLGAGKLTYLGEFACSPGHSDHFGKVFLVTGLKKGAYSRDPGEFGIKVKAFTPAQIDTMIKKGIIIDSWTIVAFYFFKNYLGKKK